MSPSKGWREPRKRTVRSKRATAIAQQFVASAGALAGLLETVSQEVWDLPVPTDGRTVGIVTKHLADSPPVVISIARSVSAGGKLPSWEAIHEWNAQMAKTNAGCDRRDTIRALREAATASIESIEKFTDDELDVTTVNHEGLTRSVADLLQGLLVGHTLQHTGDIQKALVNRTESGGVESRDRATHA